MVEAYGDDEEVTIPVRSPLKCELETGVCQACYGRAMATGKDGRARRRGRHHRRPVDRRAGHAADDADVPHRRRRRPRHHAGPAARRRAVRGAQAEGPGAARAEVDGKVPVEETDKGTKVVVTDSKGEEHAYSFPPRTVLLRQARRADRGAAPSSTRARSYPAELLGSAAGPRPSSTSSARCSGSTRRRASTSTTSTSS